MLQTQRLLLRDWQPSDLAPLAQMNADAEVMKYFPAILSWQESEALLERIKNHHQVHGFGLWAIEERATGSFMGFIGLNVPKFQAHFTPAVEVGWRLATAFWGKGYATEGARKAISYGFEVIGLTEIVSFTAQSNLRSIAVMKRLGMTHQEVDNFDHPSLPSGHPLQRHVLYRLSNNQP
ncbi:MAG: GNAT family N-acetyltransferase [Symploca sp. SIO2G7]|nr:GNAT family N-acetyltransferase [Symploca sp. SIO2G7]